MRVVGGEWGRGGYVLRGLWRMVGWVGGGLVGVVVLVVSWAAAERAVRGRPRVNRRRLRIRLTAQVDCRGAGSRGSADLQRARSRWGWSLWRETIRRGGLRVTVG